MIYELLWKAYRAIMELTIKIEDKLYMGYLGELSMRMQWKKNKRDAGWEE